MAGILVRLESLPLYFGNGTLVFLWGPTSPPLSVPVVPEGPTPDPWCQVDM